MRIEDQMVETANRIINSFGKGCIVSKRDIVCEFLKIYPRNASSVIPSDYCYNRINDDFQSQIHPALFEYIGRNSYRCWGENHPYNGLIYQKPKGRVNDEEVGECVNGVRKYYVL